MDFHAVAAAARQSLAVFVSDLRLTVSMRRLALLLSGRFAAETLVAGCYHGQKAT
jgi:hypothetical protein